jgi:hypothetical protein
MIKQTRTKANRERMFVGCSSSTRIFNCDGEYWVSPFILKEERGCKTIKQIAPAFSNRNAAEIVKVNVIICRQEDVYCPGYYLIGVS